MFLHLFKKKKLFNLFILYATVSLRPWLAIILFLVKTRASSNSKWKDNKWMVLIYCEAGYACENNESFICVDEHKACFF